VVLKVDDVDGGHAKFLMLMGILMAVYFGLRFGWGEGSLID